VPQSRPIRRGAFVAHTRERDKRFLRAFLSARGLAPDGAGSPATAPAVDACKASASRSCSSIESRSDAGCGLTVGVKTRPSTTTLPTCSAAQVVIPDGVAVLMQFARRRVTGRAYRIVPHARSGIVKYRERRRGLPLLAANASEPVASRKHAPTSLSLADSPYSARYFYIAARIGRELMPA
jgi:hypothetical protein